MYNNIEYIQRSTTWTETKKLNVYGSISKQETEQTHQLTTESLAFQATFFDKQAYDSKKKFMPPQPLTNKPNTRAHKTQCFERSLARLDELKSQFKTVTLTTPTSSLVNNQHEENMSKKWTNTSICPMHFSVLETKVKT